MNQKMLLFFLLFVDVHVWIRAVQVPVPTVPVQVINIVSCMTRTEATVGNCCNLGDTTGDTYQEGKNITAVISLRCDLSILTELWLDESKIVILSPGDKTITQGKEIMDRQDIDRWFLTFTFVKEKYKSSNGDLHISLHIRNVQRRDTRPLHMELRTDSTIFKTKGKDWIQVRDPHVNTTEQDGDGGSVPNCTASEDLLMENRVLRKKNEALNQNLSSITNELIKSQKDYIDVTKNSFSRTTVILLYVVLTVQFLVITLLLAKIYRIGKSAQKIKKEDYGKWIAKEANTIAYIGT